MKAESNENLENSISEFDIKEIKQKNYSLDKDNNDEKRNQLHKFKSNEDEDIISVIFSSLDQNIHYSIPCKKSDSFSKIEQKLYKEFPQYKEKNKFFLVNGNKIEVNNTLEENNIKNSDVIKLNFVEDIQ